jgi:hypothetical protein
LGRRWKFGQHQSASSQRNSIFHIHLTALLQTAQRTQDQDLCGPEQCPNFVFAPGIMLNDNGSLVNFTVPFVTLSL